MIAHNNIPGLVIGGGLGFIKGVDLNLHEMVLLHLSWSVVGETAILSGVGALVGLLFTFYGRKLLKKIHKA